MKNDDKILKIYTDLDSLFDSKRGLIQKKIGAKYQDLPLVTRIGKTDQLFNTEFLKTYKNRQYHLFNCPEFDITPEWFIEAYNNRSNSDFDYYYPTDLSFGMRPIALGIENTKAGYIAFEDIELYVNIHPYELDEELIQELISGLRNRSEIATIKIVNEDVNNVTANFFSAYNYVFKHDLMFGYEKFHNSLGKVKIPKTTFILPKLWCKQTEDFSGSITTACEVFSSLLMPVIGLHYVDKSLYDCYK